MISDFYNDGYSLIMFTNSTAHVLVLVLVDYLAGLQEEHNAKDQGRTVDNKLRLKLSKVGESVYGS